MPEYLIEYARRIREVRRAGPSNVELALGVPIPNIILLALFWHH
jgi:hypothetical protein